jgi:hypothetical protein
MSFSCRGALLGFTSLLFVPKAFAAGPGVASGKVFLATAALEGPAAAPWFS